MYLTERVEKCIKEFPVSLRDNEKYKFIGDCSGRSRSIVSAACMGYQLADKL
jgi:hypothetical protein